MAEKGYFFNSIEGDPREYQAEDFANYFNKFIPTGVFQNAQGLAVTADGSSMNVTVGTGAAFIDGYMYENDEPLTLTHDVADPNYDRIDLVVVRLDRNYGVRNVYSAIIQGTPGPNPQAPQLIDDGYIKDIPLAEVRIRAGQSTIGQSQITDKRGSLLHPFAKIESGSNANGSYIRFPDGTQICYIARTRSQLFEPEDNENRGFVYTNKPLPASFIMNPRPVVQVNGFNTTNATSQFSGTVRSFGHVKNETTFHAGIRFPGSQTITEETEVFMYITVIGRWK